MNILEEEVKDELIKKFAYLEGKIAIPKPRRIYVEIALANFEEVFLYAARELNFSHLCTITGLDEGENLGIVYHLARKGKLLNFRTSVPKNNPVLKSIIKYFPGAEIYERELADLFGVKVEGLPEGYRYPLEDNWPDGQYPLRKDWGKSASKS